MILSGTREATIQQVRLVDIHGTKFYDVSFSHDDEPGQLRSARLEAQSIYQDPRPGDSVLVSYLMNTPISVKKRESA